ncbi:hypothetical protein T492DRAFT_1099633 [Pavlovales sp. CCMP2436]|nr:hypothetical protein T492DRAFT_1099633 [Pavlovales sp. CCMP2436]
MAHDLAVLRGASIVTDDLPSWAYDLAVLREAGIVTAERLGEDAYRDWADKEVAYGRYGGVAVAVMVIYCAVLLLKADGLPARAWCRLSAVLALLAADYSLSSGYWRSLISASCLFILCQHPDEGGSTWLLLCGDIRAVISSVDLHKACRADEGSMRWRNWFALLGMLWVGHSVQTAAAPLRGLVHAALDFLGCSERVFVAANFVLGASIRWVDYRARALHAASVRKFLIDCNYLRLAILLFAPITLYNLSIMVLGFVYAGAQDLLELARQAAVARWHLDTPGYSVVGKSFHILCDLPWLSKDVLLWARRMLLAVKRQIARVRRLINEEGHTVPQFCFLAVVAFTMLTFRAIWEVICWVWSWMWWIVLLLCAFVCWAVPCILPVVLFVGTPVIRAFQLEWRWLAGWAVAAWLRGQSLLAAAVLGFALTSVTAGQLVPWALEQHEAGLLGQHWLLRTALACSPHRLVLAAGDMLRRGLAPGDSAHGDGTRVRSDSDGARAVGRVRKARPSGLTASAGAVLEAGSEEGTGGKGRVDGAAERVGSRAGKQPQQQLAAPAPAASALGQSNQRRIWSNAPKPAPRPTSKPAPKAAQAHPARGGQAGSGSGAPPRAAPPAPSPPPPPSQQQQPPPPAAAALPPPTLAAQLLQLSDLFAGGLLTAVEFSRAKAVILGTPGPAGAAARRAEQGHAAGELPDELDSQSDSSCVICLERKKTHAFVPMDVQAQCLHKCVCEMCASNIKQLPRVRWLCPMCRTAARDIKFVFD